MAIAIAIAIFLPVIGSIIFHFASPWWFTPLASNWQAIDDTIYISLWITGLVFVLVGFFLAYTVYKFSYDKNRKAHYEPENKKLEAWLTLFTSVGVVAMLAPGLVVWGQFISVPANSSIVEAVGQQWHWSYRLPGKDGILGKSAVHLITQANPFGIAHDDINGRDDLLINSPTLHLPINITHKILLRSKDVLHNFAVPQFRVKMDLVPGTATYVWFTPTKLGKFELLCEELCGIAHFTMRGHIVVQSQKEYLAWQDTLPTFAELLVSNTPNQMTIARGQKLYRVCTACHGSKAEGIKALNAPKLAGLSRWYLTRQLSYFKEGVRGQHRKDKYGAQMATMSSLLTSKDSINDLSAYLASLSDTALLITHNDIDTTRGKQLFTHCAYCHGTQGEGNYAMNAPKLAGQYDWYLKRQLTNYRQGIRGKHNGDLYGQQMRLMAKTVHNEQDINQLLSYINSLPN